MEPYICCGLLLWLPSSNRSELTFKTVPLQAPAALSIEPLKLAPGNTLTLRVGEAVPASEVSVVDGHQKQITRALLVGEMHTLEITQRLWRITAPGVASPLASEPTAARKGRCVFRAIKELPSIVVYL